ncbi:hypothetical protein GGQ97_001252 [Sphingomonas kaistensis]|uniref:DUF192 domain-containing protein n=1 Tax=Sphingomonas kaistensis TaxID=298708 RepID=A0A7X5Y5A6_9SPHN|nr:DUF192 domain-containing protein [Sphingomonas kaistensis]NJC05459.1 hypothetical protein [Sphingomonas kaistensis]
MSRLALLAALPLSLTAAACQPTGGASPQLERSAAGLQQVPLTVRTAAGAVHNFTVEVASTPEEQQMGLMNRPSLAPDRGMIFPHEPPRMASFWMKNTLIPLDIIFVRPDGTIVNIAENTVPLSLEPVASLEAVGAVLELAGGRTAELGIKAGDKVEWVHTAAAQ